MSAFLLSPSLFEDSDSDPTQSTTSAASEINRILYNLPSVSDLFNICLTYAKLIFNTSDKDQIQRLRFTRIVSTHTNRLISILMRAIRETLAP
jgi:hypothetical protein